MHAVAVGEEGEAAMQATMPEGVEGGDEENIEGVEAAADISISLPLLSLFSPPPLYPSLAL